MAHPVKGLYLGIDLTGSAKKPSAYAVLDDTLAIVEWSAARTDDDLTAIVDRLNPCVTAIDAPLTLPAGLCCMEAECACAPSSEMKGRQTERDLSKMGMQGYYSGKRSIIKALVYRGMVLDRAWRAAGYTVIEIYPYASKVRLFGRAALPRKSTIAGTAALIAATSRVLGYTPELPQVSGVEAHDLLDALIAAHTAWCYHHKVADAVGAPAEGVIWIPAAQAPV